MVVPGDYRCRSDIRPDENGGTMALKVTGGSLYHLWRVSDVHLPRIADVYYDANRLVNGGKVTSTGYSGGPSTTSNDTDAFRDNTPAYPGASVMSSSVGAAWSSLRDELQTMYAEIGSTILTAADGVRQATKDFVDADMANKDDLQKYLSDPKNHNANDVGSNPPLATADDYPGEPVLPDGSTYTDNENFTYQDPAYAPTPADSTTAGNTTAGNGAS